MTVTKSMCAARWLRSGHIDLDDTATPALQAGQVLLRVGASGICGTDLHISRGETPHAAAKVIIGHEFSGFVEAIHPETKTAVAVGDCVAVDPNIPCHQCTFCNRGKYHLCPSLISIGVNMHGGMAPFVTVPANAVHRIPGHVSVQVASLAEPLSCVVHAVDLGCVKGGDRVLVLGAGPIGLMTLSLCASAGAQVTVVDPIKSRRDLALREFHAVEVHAPGEIHVDNPCLGDGFDVVFECVGRPEAMEVSVSYAKAGGTIVWVGVAKPGAQVAVKPFDIYRRELTIKSTYVNPFCMERAIDILAQNKVNWNALITHTFPLNEFDQAWETFVSGVGIKICVLPTSSS